MIGLALLLLFTAIGFAPGGSGPYTTQLQQKTYNNNNKKHTIKTSTFHRTPYTVMNLLVS
jgi:hypothetical protein